MSRSLRSTNARPVSVHDHTNWWRIDTHGHSHGRPHRLTRSTRIGACTCPCACAEMHSSCQLSSLCMCLCPCLRAHMSADAHVCTPICLSLDAKAFPRLEALDQQSQRLQLQSHSCPIRAAGLRKNLQKKLSQKTAESVA